MSNHFIYSTPIQMRTAVIMMSQLGRLPSRPRHETRLISEGVHALSYLVQRALIRAKSNDSQLKDTPPLSLFSCRLTTSSPSMTSPSSRTKVIIVGAGIAGPVLATFLKLKGYEPVVYERTSGVGDRGIGHGIAHNGLAVLDQIPGLLDSMEKSRLDRYITYSAIEEDKRVLLDMPAKTPPGIHSTIVVRRAALHKAIIDIAVKNDVQIKWDHKLVDLEQHEDSVTVKFENGTEDTASFVVGSDGLHSNTRICLFGEQKADYTGLVQTGGIAPTPECLKEPRVLLNVYGNGMHIIALPVNDTQTCWALTQSDPEESKESWNAVDNHIADEIKNSEAATWDHGISELIGTTENFIKYGLYDRPELKTWHKGRVILIGDAAHPTSPHLGQGANQALEDVNTLVTLLETYNISSSASPSTETLETMFTEMEARRIPESSKVVKGARRQGELRVVKGVEACIKRNNEYMEIWKNRESLKKWVGNRD
ncbi:hypothetical protein BDY19DRAFT_955012 [Irpex rosettiformis]|uniref:Uncharacterized protein n=1 Tax=Irpex rosettiformis TaxID=378272 RepID=A0ACB8TZ01_9APHY|nr:hypothetical protein BDY19DRAFT_955012 [Irpex rosettiformis]